MLTLLGLRAVRSQTMTTTIDEGTINITLRFNATIKMWAMDVEFEDFYVYNVKVCHSPNILDQYSSILPFGILVSVGTLVGYEPSIIDDFYTGRVTLNILGNDEMEEIESVYKELKDVV